MWNQICALAGILLSHDPQELVSAGPALIDFDRLVFFPKRLDQFQRFYLRHAKHLKPKEEKDE
jgi:hypothetical protein